MADQYGQFHKRIIHCLNFSAGCVFKKQFSERNLHFIFAVIFQLTSLPVTYLRLGGGEKNYFAGNSQKFTKK